MTARIGPNDVLVSATADAALLSEVTGLRTEPGQRHVLVDDPGVRSLQRIAIGDIGGGIIAGIWPGELKSQATYLYSDSRAFRLLEVAEPSGWTVQPSLHLAFYNSSHQQRLYLDPEIPAVEYVKRWVGVDQPMIGRHETSALRGSIWPWLEMRGYVGAGDLAVLEQFERILGARKVDVRPALRLQRRWENEDAARLCRSGALADEIRLAFNAVLRALDEPLLPYLEQLKESRL